MQVAPELLQVDRRAEEVRTPGPPLDGVRRIVVVRDDRLGDLVLSLPAVAALRRAYPSARLALMVRPSLEPLARMVDGVERVMHAVDDGTRLGRQLEEFDTDLLVCVSRWPTVAWAAVRSGVRHRVGTGYRVYSPLFTRRVNERRRAGARHELEYALSFAHRAGAGPGPACFGLSVPDDAGAAATRWLESLGVDEPYVLIHPGSGGSCPPWPVEHHLRLAHLLVEQRVRVVLSIGPADRDLARALDVADLSHLRALPRTGAGLQELAALSRLAAVVVSNTTGPLHLAAALGTPTLAFHPPWPTCGVARWGPYAANGWALVAACEQALGWSRDDRRRRSEELMRGIAPEVAARCVVDLLAGRPPQG